MATEEQNHRHAYRRMKKSDLTCPECGAGYRRIELASEPGRRGEYRCLVCDHVLEVFDGSMTGYPWNGSASTHLFLKPYAKKSLRRSFRGRLQVDTSSRKGAAEAACTL
jgi:predicted Zn finger-like uncharacterized protein